MVGLLKIGESLRDDTASGASGVYRKFLAAEFHPARTRVEPIAEGHSFSLRGKSQAATRITSLHDGRNAVDRPSCRRSPTCEAENPLRENLEREIDFPERR